MSREIIEKVKCDRCGKEKEVPAKESTDMHQVPILHVSAGGHKVLEFADLCDKCEKRCDDLVSQLRKDPQPTKTKAKTNKTKSGDLE